MLTFSFDVWRLIVELGYRSSGTKNERFHLFLYFIKPVPLHLVWKIAVRSFQLGTLSREKFFQTKAELSAARSINNKQDVDDEQDGSNKQGHFLWNPNLSQTIHITSEVIRLCFLDVAYENTDSLLSVIKDRFSSNLDNSVHSIIFLGLVQENGVEVNRRLWTLGDEVCFWLESWSL